MNSLYVIAATVLTLALLTRLRVGAMVVYSEGGIEVKLRFSRFLITLFPIVISNKKRERVPKNKKSHLTKPNKPKGGLLEVAMEFLPLVLETIGKFKRKLRADKLELELTVASPDPAQAAMQYGQANALLSSMWYPMTQAFHVVNGHAHVGIDFDASKSTLYLLVSLSLNLGQVLSVVAVFGVKAIRTLIRIKRKNRQSIQGEAV